MDGSDKRLKPKIIILNDLYIDPNGYQVKLGQNEIELTTKEFNLLYLFASNVGKLVRRSEILQIMLNPRIIDEDRAINVAICRLRKKIEINPHRPRRLISVRSLGYRLKE